MILSIIRVIVGIIALFLPGYLLSFILFKKLKIIERICLAIGLSIVIIVFLGFFLTVISYLTNTKVLITQVVWLSLLIICIIFIILIISKYKT